MFNWKNFIVNQLMLMSIIFVLLIFPQMISVWVK